MQNITRRLFLRNTAAAGAVGATIAAPVAVEAAQPMTPRERFDAAVEQLKAAAKEIDPRIERWDCSIAEDDRLGCGVAILAYRRTGQYEGDGIYEGGGSWNGNPIKYRVTLRPDLVDGHRAFDVRTSMDHMILPEPRFNTFIVGGRIA